MSAVRARKVEIEPPAHPCPRCRVSLLPATGGLAERVCARCTGRFLESGGVQRLVFEEHGIEPELIRELVTQFAGERGACPCCKSQMSPVQVRGEHVELCEGCGGMWLEAGALERLGEGRWQEVPPTAEQIVDALAEHSKLPPPPPKPRRRRRRIDAEWWADWNPARWTAWSLVFVAASVIAMAAVPRTTTIECIGYSWWWGTECRATVERYIGDPTKHPVSYGPEPDFSYMPRPGHAGQWTIAIDGQPVQAEFWFSKNSWDARRAAEEFATRVEAAGTLGASLTSQRNPMAALVPIPMAIGQLGLTFAGLLWWGRWRARRRARAKRAGSPS
jgi:Zn-finger nucleic acid-binding protein